MPATAGGPVDTAVRMIEPGLVCCARRTAWSLLNRPGASGTVGMQSVATADPNGYTIGQGVNSIFTITRVSGTNVPVHPRQLHPARQLRDRRQRAGGSSRGAVEDDRRPDRPCARQSGKDHLCVGRRRHGVVAEHAGAATSFQAGHDGRAVSGRRAAHRRHSRQHVDIGMVPYTTGAALFRENKLRPLVTTAQNRLPPLPDVPTLAEKGIKANGLNLIMGLYAPHGLPDGVQRH